MTTKTAFVALVPAEVPNGEADDAAQFSVSSLGTNWKLPELDFPDLLLISSNTAENKALETFFDLLAYVAQRGEALPNGDTVGRTEQEQLPVRYFNSPIDFKKKVWRVELP